MPDPDEQLRAAVSAGDLPGVQAALAAGASMRAASFALREAAQDNRLAIVECLIAAGADVNMDDALALRWAAEDGHLAIVQCLLAAGADVNAKNGAALLDAAENGLLAVVQCLIDAGAYTGDGRAMICAAARREAAVVALLLTHGAPSRYITGHLHTYSPAVQAATITASPKLKLSIRKAARQGICPEALCALLERRGHPELAAMLAATHMLEPLTPDERATLLRDLVSRHKTQEVSHAP